MKIFNKQINEPICIVLVGLPGSGKSTWINNLKNKDDFVIISSDNILEEIAESKGLTYDNVWNSHIGMATKIMKEQFSTGVLKKKNLIIDQTNMSSQKRKSILEKLSNDYYKICIIFDISNKTLFERLGQRSKTQGKTIRKDIIESMIKKYSTPNKSEGFDEIIRITV